MSWKFLKTKPFIIGCLLGAVISVTSLTLEPMWLGTGLSRFDLPRYLMIGVYLLTPRGCSEYWGTCSPLQIKIIDISMVMTHLLSWMAIGGLVVSRLVVLKRKLKE
jgi:hypothetical protein